MTIPNVAEFCVVSYDIIGPRLQCPQCGDWIPVDDAPSIRELINVATEHNNTTHAMSEPHHIIRAWTSTGLST